MKRSDIETVINDNYLETNTRLRDSILRLQKAVVDLVKEQENSHGFNYFSEHILDPCIQDMKEVAKRHAKFIAANKIGQIQAVRTNKTSDAFKLGASMLIRIKKGAKGGTIQSRLIRQFPVSPINSESIVSGGTYRMFNKYRQEFRRKTSDASYDENIYDKISRTGKVLESVTTPNQKSLTPFYENIMGSALVTAYQAMLITMYAKLKGINIAEEYPRLLDELKRENILDITQDVNVIVQPVKNPKGKSPFSLDDPSLMATLTALYEYGGTKCSQSMNASKKIMDCSQFSDYVFNTRGVFSEIMVDDIERLRNGEIENVQKSEAGKILKQAEKVVHYDMKNATPIERAYKLDRLMANAEGGDMVVWRGHVGFVSVSEGKKRLLSYTRHRGTRHEATVSSRTFHHFSEHPDFEKMALRTANVDGLTKDSPASFARLASTQDLYVIKFPEQAKPDDRMPNIENVEYPRSPVGARRTSGGGLSL